MCRHGWFHIEERRSKVITKLKRWLFTLTYVVTIYDISYQSERPKEVTVDIQIFAELELNVPADNEDSTLVISNSVL